MLLMMSLFCFIPLESRRLLAHHGLKMPCNPRSAACEQPSFHWDLGNNIWMGCNKHHQNVLPCIAKGHNLWDVRRMRPWLGLQLMMAQGFPKDMKLKYDPDDPSIPQHIHPIISREFKNKAKEVTDSDLRNMAGNTMTIPVMGILQVATKLSSSLTHPFRFFKQPLYKPFQPQPCQFKSNPFKCVLISFMLHLFCACQCMGPSGYIGERLRVVPGAHGPGVAHWCWRLSLAVRQEHECD